jgi:hypothetical protein
MYKAHWTYKDYMNERRRFIGEREFKTSTLGVALLLGATIAVGWMASYGLRKLGLTSMPLRYGISYLLAYASFFLWVRIWADFQKLPPKDYSTAQRGTDELRDASLLGGGEAGLFIILMVGLGLVGAVFMSLVSAFAVLLEVAFELAFAGVVVKRAFHADRVVGQWWRVLFKRTWLFAVAMGAALMVSAAWLQSLYPSAVGLGQVLQIWRGQ